MPSAGPVLSGRGPHLLPGVPEQVQFSGLSPLAGKPCDGLHTGASARPLKDVEQQELSSPLVGMQSGAATVEDSLVVYYGTKRTPAVTPSSHTP